MELRLQIETSSELFQWAIVTVVSPVARRRLVEIENPTACATVD
jgi:hypothetical protein